MTTKRSTLQFTGHEVRPNPNLLFAWSMLGKRSKDILSNGGLMLTYHSTIRKKKSPRKTNPRLRIPNDP